MVRPNLPVANTYSKGFPNSAVKQLNSKYKLAYVYFEDEPGRRSAAKLSRRDAAKCCRQCDLGEMARSYQLRGQPFDPEAIEAMGKALLRTCETLGLSGDGPLTQRVAQKIIELAERGLRNPTALHLAAIKGLKVDLH